MDERSLKDGAGPEAIAVGVACGRMIMVTATEKQGTAFVLDVTDPANTTLLFTRHLSPASETKNPSVAYNDGTLGEVDPESITFLDAHDSPTGYAGVLFAGAWSGTLSFYEFTKADGTKCGSLPPKKGPTRSGSALALSSATHAFDTSGATFLPSAAPRPSGAASSSPESTAHPSSA